ncbi:ethanolamine ammonia-lyase reactivating factor EutA [Bacillus sp. JJ722]|uniref:ethanolamine ammonia-lyase reactivating factor EutA n=1 Tax=Bacillus sp. JJ722 TaxID=3122973 RepID=UPI002FFF768F
MIRDHSHKEVIISVGIDIGTSTTKMVISELSLMNTAGGARMPRIEIIDKKVIHRSPIYRTPLLSMNAIDMKNVEKIVEDEYRKAGIHVDEVKTGAVIITGETATKKNASEMIHHLSNHAGEFLVATAGPDLESIIAAKGSGAYQYSQKTSKVIANIDIGGGTANIAVYKLGRLCGTCTLHIGGRLIEMDNGRIKHLSLPVKQLAANKGLSLSVGDMVTNEELREISNSMSHILARVLKRNLQEEDHVLLLGHEPSWEEDIDVIMFSGGVSECLYQMENRAHEYEDIGQFIADSLQENQELHTWEWIHPNETVRATVLGAGTQTTEISGATIQVDRNELPIKNLPVYQVDFMNGFDQGIKQLELSMKEANDMYDSQSEGENFGLYLVDLPYLSFHHIQRLGQSLIEVFKLRSNQNHPIVVILESDYGKVLGQTMKMLAPMQNIICVDQIKVENGDYLDIGQMLESDVVPVVIKTLTFHS